MVRKKMRGPNLAKTKETKGRKVRTAGKGEGRNNERALLIKGGTFGVFPNP